MSYAIGHAYGRDEFSLFIVDLSAYMLVSLSDEEFKHLTALFDACSDRERRQMTNDTYRYEVYDLTENVAPFRAYVQQLLQRGRQEKQ